MNKQLYVTNQIRRKLLKVAIYAPPVILGSMVATPRSVMGAVGDLKICDLTAGGTVSITISSGTNACCPCITGAEKFDSEKCSEKQCKKSCGANCTPALIADTKCKDFCKNCGFVVAGCKDGPCNCQWNAKKAKFKCV